MFNTVKLKFWNKRSLTITDYDPVYKVTYLGNVLTCYAKGDGCVDKPLATLWKNYNSNLKHAIRMKLTICNSGLKAVTREHGLTEYWANRVTYCICHPQYPKVFCWIYRHEGRKMKQELRCHAVLCNKEEKARQMAELLSKRLVTALEEFRREKKLRQNARLSLANSCLDIPLIPVRKQFLVKGMANFRPPLERSKSAPRLTAIEEIKEEREVESDSDDEDIYTNGSGSVSGSVFSEIPESSSDFTAEDIEMESLSEQYVTIIHNGQQILNPSFNCDFESVVDEVPNPLKRRTLSSINENTFEDHDNVSDESGFSEPDGQVPTSTTAKLERHLTTFKL